LHFLAHTPQLFASVWVFVSQPFEAWPSQLEKPALHALITQLPVAQVAVALARLQAVPHEPQLVSVVRLVSQPLVALLSQLPQPALQVKLQAPELQAVVPWALVQALPQLPQFCVLVLRLTSQPFDARPSQSAVPAAQVAQPQAPLTQLGVVGQVHTFGQLPQWFTLVLRLVSQPPAGFESQSPKPAAQVGLHTPAVQVVVPFVFVQAVLQSPQCVVSLVRLVSHPFAALLSQLP
jgi:hypothetical protein